LQIWIGKIVVMAEEDGSKALSKPEMADDRKEKVCANRAEHEFFLEAGVISCTLG